MLSTYAFSESRFTYANVVYITDSTCRYEITSWKEHIEIEPAKITPEMLSRHEHRKKILREDPAMCATHLVLVVDQSGSMKKADAPGFRNRSKAAYGIIALELIAEQLGLQGDDFALDVVSLIEMRDTASVIFRREPLDWVLFNKLLQRQEEAEPMSHGNYVPALEAARDLILSEAAMLEAAELDQVAVKLVFLSDGRPSDGWPYVLSVSLSTSNITTHVSGLLCRSLLDASYDIENKNACHFVRVHSAMNIRHCN